MLIKCPPRPDLVWLNIVHEMMLNGATCEGTPVAGGSRQVIINGREIKMEEERLLQLAVIFAAKYLFDFTDCADTLPTLDMSCTLLYEYDRYMTKTRSQSEQELQSLAFDGGEIARGSDDEAQASAGFDMQSNKAEGIRRCALLARDQATISMSMRKCLGLKRHSVLPVYRCWRVYTVL